MPRRGENIYKRKDGRWECRILKPDGKYKSVYARTYKEVKVKKDNAKKDLETAKASAADGIGNLASVFETWLKSDVAMRVKLSTYESYYRCIQKYVAPYYLKEGSGRLTENNVKSFVKTINENDGLSTLYKIKILSIFKTALKEIAKRYTAYTCMADYVKLPKVEAPAVQVFTIKEQLRIENVLLNAGGQREFGILLCFYTGMRLGEICALRWEDIDSEAGLVSVLRTVTRTKNFHDDGSKTTLLVGTPKSKLSVRKIPLPEFLVKMSNELKKHAGKDENYILTGSSAPSDPRTFQKYFEEVLIKAEVKKRKFHSIRHTFATRALELGVDIKTLSELLGHSKVSTTLNIYAHSLMEQKKIAMNKLDEMHKYYAKHL